MNENTLDRSNNPDVVNSLAAMKRAARRAREVGRLSGTGIVIWKDGRVVRIPADQIMITDGEVNEDATDV